MEFKLPYVLAMREHAPQMFKDLCRSGKLEEHLKEKSQEAHALFVQLTVGAEKLPSGAIRDSSLEAPAKRQVFDMLIEFSKNA